MKSSNTLTILFCKESLEHSTEDILDYFTSLALELNADKTENIVFGKKYQLQSLQIREQKIVGKAQVKNLGETIDNEINHQTEVKNLLSKIDPSTKCLYNLRDCRPKNLLPVMINWLVISHLQFQPYY